MNGTFLTGKSRIQQTDKSGYWMTLDNELYYDFNEDRIYVVPRYFWSDSYTFPRLLLIITGDKNRDDVRPSHQHDLFCRFHERLYTTLSFDELCTMGLLYEHEKGFMVCEDIPKEYLVVEKIKKWKADNLLREMMISCNISKFKAGVARIGVFFNINWLKTGKRSLKTYNIYKEEIGLVDGR